MVRYTQSPGGIRRGLIWQSSDSEPHKREWRNFIVSPYTFAFGGLTKTSSTGKFTDENISQMQMPSGATQIGDEITNVQGVRITMSNIRALQNPGFPYQTVIKQHEGVNYIATLADLQYYEADVDMYIYPRGLYREKTEILTYHDFYPNYEAPVDYYQNGAQLNQNNGITGRWYYDYCDGNSQSNWDYFQRSRIITPSLPMRIKGKILFCDYPYAINAYETGSSSAARNAQINYESLCQLMMNKLASYSYPSDSEFAGASINSPQSGDFYQLQSIPSFQVASGARYDTSSSSTANQQRWRMTNGICYDGLNQDYQFFFSPIAYPHSKVDDGLNDYRCYITGTDYDSNFLKHDDPMFMSPMMNMPRADYVNQTYPIKRTPDNQNVINTQHIHPHRRKMLWTPGTSSHSNAGNYWKGGDSIFTPEVATPIDPCILLPMGLTEGTTSQTVADVANITFNIAEGIGARYYDESVLQPLFYRGQKYIQEVSPELAMHMFEVITTTGACSGRYKYCGFKGKVSFFEMP